MIGRATVETLRPRRRPPAWVGAVLLPIAGVLLALLIGAVLIAIARVNPLTAYAALVKGAVGGGRQLTETALLATPLLIIGLGMTVAFRCRVWNIGAEGQYTFGALAGGIVSLALPGIPQAPLAVLMLLAGVAAGAVWAGLAAVLKVRYRVSEIISTLMLNYIAYYLMLFMARVPFKDPSSNLPQTAKLTPMPTIFDSRLHVGVALALFLVPVVYVLLFKMPIGFRWRAVGSNPNTARFAGINVERQIITALMFSGALAGLAGILQVSTLIGRLKDGISGGFGFTAILVALLGRLNPVGVLIAAVFFAVLNNGAEAMSISANVPVAIATVIQALVVLFMLGGDALARRLSQG
jgi:general nucleoside transport system permease protein